MVPSSGRHLVRVLAATQALGTRPSSACPAIDTLVRCSSGSAASTSSLHGSPAAAASRPGGWTRGHGGSVLTWALPMHGARCRSMSSSSAAGSGGTLVSFPLAQTGEGISECELMQWFVKAGDPIEEFQPLCEVQSDKASIEITSKYGGTVEVLHHAPGDMVKVGAPLVDIRVAGEAAEGAEPAAATAPPAAAAAPAGASASTAAPPGAPPAPAGPAERDVFASPAVRRLAKEMGVDLAAVAGSGDKGRVLREDGERHSAQAGAPSANGAGAPYDAARVPAAPAASPDHANGAAAALPEPLPPLRVPIRGYRRAMVKSSTEAGAVPMFHFFDEVSMDALMGARAALKGDPLLGGTKLTFLPFVIKALSVTLGRYPGLGAQLSADQDVLVTPRSHNVGVAMATAGGLVVPNVKQVEAKGVVAIAQELAHLQQLAGAGKLEVRHVTGGTLTISNIGTIGGNHATPLVNPPESAILALGRVRPVAALAGPAGDGVVRRHVMAVSWGADHRVVDGATVAEASNHWKALLEEPLRLLLHTR